MRPTVLRIDLDAIRANFKVAKQCAPNSKVLACVKSDAYGHGMVSAATAIAEQVDAFGVASLDEALMLRSAGIASPILLFEGFFDEVELNKVVEEDFWVTVHSQHQIDMLKTLRNGSQLRVWLKMDTGMHRLGFASSDYMRAYHEITDIPSVEEVVLMTHFACADELENEFTAGQIEEFNRGTLGLSEQRSLANSAAVLAWQKSHMDWVRPGFMLYGASPFAQPHSVADQLVPSMEFLSEVIALREISAGEGVGYNHSWIASQDSRIAILAVGYGDGYPRNTSNGTPVLIGGQRAATVGHVAMDMMLVDVTGLADIHIGAAAELWGKNLSVGEVAMHSGFSPYELMTRLTGRVQRNYLSTV